MTIYPSLPREIRNKGLSVVMNHVGGGTITVEGENVGIPTVDHDSCSNVVLFQDGRKEFGGPEDLVRSPCESGVAIETMDKNDIDLRFAVLMNRSQAIVLDFQALRRSGRRLFRVSGSDRAERRVEG